MFTTRKNHTIISTQVSAYLCAYLLFLAAVCPAAEDAFFTKVDDQYDAARATSDKTTYDAAIASIRQRFVVMAQDGQVTGTFLQKMVTQSVNAPTYFAFLDEMPDKAFYTAALQNALLSAPGWEERDVFAFHLARVTTTCADADVFNLLRDDDDSLAANFTKLAIAHAFVTSKPTEVQAFALALSNKLCEVSKNSASAHAIEIAQELNDLLVLLGTKDAASALEENLIEFGSTTDWSAAIDNVHQIADPRMYISFLNRSLTLARVDAAGKATIVETLFAHDVDFPRTPRLTSILAQIATELEADGRENSDFADIQAKLTRQ